MAADKVKDPLALLYKPLTAHNEKERI